MSTHFVKLCKKANFQVTHRFLLRVRGGWNFCKLTKTRLISENWEWKRLDSEYKTIIRVLYKI